MARGRFDEDEISQISRSKRLLSNDAICGLIGEAEAVVAARQWSLMYWSRGEGNSAAHKNGCRGHPRKQDCLKAAHQRIRAVALIPCQILALIHHVEYTSMDAEASIEHSNT